MLKTDGGNPSLADGIDVHSGINEQRMFGQTTEWEVSMLRKRVSLGVGADWFIN